MLNPYKVPLEPDYTDNSLSLTLPLNPSPSLSVEMFMLNYTIGGVYYSPRLVEDVYQAFSWIQRAYPLGGAPGEYFKPRAWTADFGEMLGGLVNRSNPVCTLLYPPPDSDPSLCASYFMNAVLWTYRVETLMGELSVGLNPFAFYYGMITDASGNFARGQAAAPFTSVGPTGIPGSNSWDTDGSYGDWYAAHEIGHSLGRAHPIAGSDDPATPDVEENCRHSRSDLSYPYGNTYTSAAPIGPYDHTLEGFDVGDPIFGIQPAVYPSDTWNDVMSYCSNQWISDYTYENMYDHMIAFPTHMATSMRLLGDYLIAAGVINPDADTAAFSILRRSNDVTNVPDLVPGDYSLRLLDASNNVLADYAFTPLLDEGTGTLGFSQVVALEPGTTTVQLVKLDGDQVLASQAISANPPAVNDVVLVDAPNPVTGVVTLEWSASDPDGDSLTYEVIFSRDDGISFMPVAAGLTGSSAQIDTASLPGTAGDNGILRVVASDGVNTGYGDTAPFVMASKMPDPFIITPEDGLHIHYGQLVNFSGMALDVQDGTVADEGLSWQDEDFQEISSGALLSLDKLPIGSNIIYLKATNSAGKSAYAQVTVYVDDDLNLLGPTLAAGPAPVGWHVGEGSTELQTAEVYINNAGSGDLDWTASEDAAWLSLDAASGTITAEGDPSTLTLTADPSGLAPNTSYSADLTITSNGLDPEQTVVIHVTLSVGDIRSVPIPEKNIYLPLVTRE